ncbi:VWA domain-containing protein [Bacillus amyloliquefaciens]|uniref:VWA domain-containing protein n=1 Tax=Bacillus amyloliquefaciens TaxID=1390 RepID=UPI002806AB66|nr:VWA domain-containing protein [Bacillus amyloliquefaciens]MDQ8093916.1 VWA domain-containing protein [Bacillus amyloliquefaciens]
MNKLQEIKLRISKLKGYENAKSTDQYWMTKEHVDFLIDRTELSVKQQAIIEEYQRQQEVAVNQFRQAREEIQRLTKEKEHYRKSLDIIAGNPKVDSLEIAEHIATQALEGAAE